MEVRVLRSVTQQLGNSLSHQADGKVDRKETQFSFRFDPNLLVNSKVRSSRKKRQIFDDFLVKRVCWTTFVYHEAKDLDGKESTERGLEGALLKRLRETVRKNQTGFAKDFGVSSRTIHNYEHGKTRIPDTFLKNILSVYGPQLAIIYDRGDAIRALETLVQELRAEIRVQARAVDGTATQEDKRDRDADAQVSEIEPSAALPKLKRAALNVRRRIRYGTDFIYLTATLVFANEYIRRAFFDSEGVAGAYRDAVYLGSFVLCCQMIVLFLVSVPSFVFGKSVENDLPERSA